MHRVRIPPDFDAWRDQAREALAAGYLPEEINFEDDTAPETLSLGLESPAQPTGRSTPKPHVPKAFLDLARFAACHRNPQRWNLLYRLLWRLQTERNLLHIEVDDDVASMYRLQSQVARDLHKMHAFVRFRKVEHPGPWTPESAPAIEHFIAWYEPDHRILHLAAPFFAERFAPMRWTILTPDASVSWEPTAHQLHFGPGVPAEAAPASDELEEMWRSYYGAIFNPARLNPKAMRSEMPVRYWRNLPEVAALPQLLQRAEARVATMVATQQQKPTATPFVPEKHTLPVLRAAMPSCRGCDLYKHATQVVPGAGAVHAALMLVGEQPGDKEDLEGVPFVGPAGAVLRRALEELRLDGKQIFMTNAVKHFKFVERGKLRLHQGPRMTEINACRPWLAAEIDAVKPRAILCLGATAAKSLLGGTFALMRDRGKPHESIYGKQILATVHPSAILRAHDDAGRKQLYEFLTADLATAYQLATKP
jgi:probable DNA metabolism protein